MNLSVIFSSLLSPAVAGEHEWLLWVPKTWSVSKKTRGNTSRKIVWVFCLRNRHKHHPQVGAVSPKGGYQLHTMIFTPRFPSWERQGSHVWRVAWVKLPRGTQHLGYERVNEGSGGKQWHHRSGLCFRTNLCSFAGSSTQGQLLVHKSTGNTNFFDSMKVLKRQILKVT